jgi:hypothetical protein
MNRAKHIDFAITATVRDSQTAAVRIQRIGSICHWMTAVLCCFVIEMTWNRRSIVSRSDGVDVDQEYFSRWFTAPMIVVGVAVIAIKLLRLKRMPVPGVSSPAAVVKEVRAKRRQFVVTYALIVMLCVAVFRFDWDGWPLLSWVLPSVQPIQVSNGGGRFAAMVEAHRFSSVFYPVLISMISLPLRWVTEAVLLERLW